MEIENKKTKNQKGFALLTAIIITGMLLLVSFVVADLSYKELILTSTGQQSQIAFYMADSGAECALYWDLKNGPTSAFDPSNNSGSVTCNGQEVHTGSQTVQTIPPQQSQVGGGGGGGASLASLNLDFENGSVSSCPTGWTCTGDAVIASASDGQGCAISGNINGNQYLKAGCDATIGTAQSQNFTLPSGIDHIRALRAGGADPSSGSGWFVKRVSDNSILCSAQNGTDSDSFFTDDCTGLSGYAGISVYIYVIDNQNSGWGKTYLDNIRLMDFGNNSLSPSSGSSIPSIFQINFANSCAIVQVTKNGDGTTKIDSKGYNTCDPSVARRFERGITITYGAP